MLIEVWLLFTLYEQLFTEVIGKKRMMYEYDYVARQN